MDTKSSNENITYENTVMHNFTHFVVNITKEKDVTESLLRVYTTIYVREAASGKSLSQL